MGQIFARNWLVPLSGCYTGTNLHSLVYNIDKGTYELSVTSEPSVPPLGWLSLFYVLSATNSGKYFLKDAVSGNSWLINEVLWNMFCI